MAAGGQRDPDLKDGLGSVYQHCSMILEGPVDVVGVGTSCLVELVIVGGGAGIGREGEKDGNATVHCQAVLTSSLAWDIWVAVGDGWWRILQTGARERAVDGGGWELAVCLEGRVAAGIAIAQAEARTQTPADMAAEIREDWRR